MKVLPPSVAPYRDGHRHYRPVAHGRRHARLQSDRRIPTDRRGRSLRGPAGLCAPTPRHLLRDHCRRYQRRSSDCAPRWAHATTLSPPWWVASRCLSWTSENIRGRLTPAPFSMPACVCVCVRACVLASARGGPSVFWVPPDVSALFIRTAVIGSDQEDSCGTWIG